MLFINFLPLFYLMVLIRCHTISKSIASYDQLDDIIDSVNEFPLTTVFNVRHERFHPKYRRHETGKITDGVTKTPEATTKSKEKTTPRVTTKATKRRETTKAHTASTTEATKLLPAPLMDNTKIMVTEKPTLNLFKRLQHKFSWKNKTAAKKSKKKRKFMFHKKHKENKDKDDRDKRGIMSTATDFSNYDTNLFHIFKPSSQKDTNHSGNFGNITSPSIEVVDSALNKYATAIEGSTQNTNDAFSSEASAPFTSPIDKFPQELQDDDTLKGTADIEQLLNKIKMHAINIISEQGHPLSEVITNSVTETTFDVDPLLHAMGQTTFSALDVKDDDVELAESATDNKKAPAAMVKENTQPKAHDTNLGYNLEYKLQREMKLALIKAKDTLAGQLNKARDQVKSVTWKIMHNAAGGLNDMADKITDERERSSTMKEVQTAIPEQSTKITTPPTEAPKPKTEIRKPVKAKTPKRRPTTTNPKSALTTQNNKLLTTTMKTNPYTTRQNRGTLITNNLKSEYNLTTEENYPQEQDDYTMLKIYENILARNDNGMRMLTTQKPSVNIKLFKDKISKRDTETIEDLNLKENIRKLIDGEGMPDADYSNNNVQKPNYERKNAPRVEVYNEGSTSSKLAETTIRELTSPDNSFIGLTNKIHYNEYINGYKHYLNFARDLSKFDHNYSNLVRYQAHRHHSVDDIGKFILTRLPPIPEWKTQAQGPTIKYRNKRFLFDEIEMSNQTTTTKNEGSWFKRHFNIFHDSDSKKKFHTEQTVTLRSDIRKPITKKKKKEQLTEPSTIEDRVPGEKEGLVFRWKTYNSVQSKATTKHEPIFSHWDTPAGDVTNTAKQDALERASQMDQPSTEIDLKDLMAKFGKIKSNETSSAELLSQADIDLSMLIKKITAESARVTMSKILRSSKSTLPMEPVTLAEGNVVTEGFDLNKILALMPTTYAPSEALYWNGLVSAYILRNYTPENPVRKSILDSPRNVINKLLNRPNRMNSENHGKDSVQSEVTDMDNAGLEELSRAKRDKKNSYVPKEEMEHIRKSTVPTNLFEDSAVYPTTQGVKFDKLAYVDLNLVQKSTPAVQKKTKKSKYKKILDKLTFKKKNKDKAPGKTRKERHSPFKMLRNLFKYSQRDPDFNSIYGTTEPYTFKLVKYADMERSLNEFMKQVPNISNADVTYTTFDLEKEQPVASMSFPKPLTDVTASPVFAITTTSGPITLDDLPSPAFMDSRPEIKKKQNKAPLTIDNEPLHLRVTPTPENIGSAPTLHLTLTPVTIDELMNDLRVNMNNNKQKTDRILPTPRTYITQNLAIERPIMTNINPKPIAKAPKMNLKHYFENIPVRDTSKFFMNRNYSAKFLKHDKNDKAENQVLGINNKFHSFKNFVFEKGDSKEENDLIGNKIKIDKDAKRDDIKFHGLKNVALFKDEKGNDILLNSLHSFGKYKTNDKSDKQSYGVNSVLYEKDQQKGSNQLNDLKKYLYDKDEKKDNIEFNAMPSLDSKLDISNFGAEKDVTTPVITFFSVKGLRNEKDGQRDSFPFNGIKNFDLDKDGFTDTKSDNIIDTEVHDIDFPQHSNEETTDSFPSHNMKNDDRDVFRVHYPRYYNKYEIQSQNSLFKHDEDTTTELIPIHSFETFRHTDDEKTIAEYKHKDNIKYDTKERVEDVQNTLNLIDSRLRNSLLVTQNKVNNKFDALTESNKAYKRTKPYKSYPDYFNDLLNWNQDILNLDSVTEASIDHVISTLNNYTTIGVHKLKEEIMHMQNYLKGLTSTKKALKQTTGSTETTQLSTEKPKSIKEVNIKMTKDDIKKKEQKNIKRRPNRHENAKTQSLDQLNQVVDNINKLYRQSFDKYGFPQNNNDKGSVLTTYNPLDGTTQVPVMDTTVFAYDDTLNILSDEFKENIYTSPKCVRSKSEKTEHKGYLASKTKISPPPEQYFRTPVPMQSKDFEQFLKDNDLDIANITKPYTEISQYEEKWERGVHVQSKLMNTRGKNEKFFDVPKMLKDLKDVNYTPKRINLGSTPAMNIDKTINSTENLYLKHKYNMPIKWDAIKNPKSHIDYVYVDDFEYTGLEDNIGTGLKSTNDAYYNDDNSFTKRSIKPLKKTTELVSHNRTTIPNGLKFDITIIDIDDIMSISKSAEFGDSNRATEETQLPKYTMPPHNNLLHSAPFSLTPKPNGTQYNSLDIDPEPENSQIQDTPDNIEIEDVPGNDEMQNAPVHSPRHNVTEEGSNQESDHVLNSDDIEGAFKHRVGDFKYQGNIIAPHLKDKITHSKFNPLVTDSLGAELFHDPTPDRKLKLRKGKKKYDIKPSDKPPYLHNDLLYHNIDFVKNAETTTEQTLVHAKSVFHEGEHKLEEKPTIDKADIDAIENILQSERDFLPRPQTRSKVYNLKVRPIQLPYEKTKQTTLYAGDDLFKPRTTTMVKTDPAVSLHQKFMKQPKRILFSSHTLKYDVMYDDALRTTKMGHHKAPHKIHRTTVPTLKYKPHRTSASNRPDLLTKVSRSTPWNDGEEGEIDVDKILREVLGGSHKGGRSRRKAMWRKWKTTTSNLTTINDTKILKADPTPPKRWFKFMPKMQKYTQKTKTTSPTTSTSTILILPSNNETSSPILLTTSTSPKYHEDIKKREQRGSDSLVYIVDVINGTNRVKLSQTSAAEGNQNSFPKPGDITFIYPAHLINANGKTKINTSEKYYVEQDWATTLKPHIPRFKTYHPPKCQSKPCKEAKAAEPKKESSECKKKNEKPKPCEKHCEGKLVCHTLVDLGNQGESPRSNETSTLSYKDVFGVGGKRDARLVSQKKYPFLNYPSSVVTSPQLYDIAEINKFFEAYNLHEKSARDDKAATEISAEQEGFIITKVTEENLEKESFNSIKEIPAEQEGFKVDNGNAENPALDPDLFLREPKAKYDKEFVKYASTCCFSDLPSLPTLKTTQPTTVNMAKLKQEIANLEKGIEARKMLSQEHKNKSKVQIDIDAVLDKIEKADSETESKLPDETTSITETSTDTKEKVVAEMKKIAKEHAAAAAKASAEAQKTAAEQAAEERKASAEAQKTAVEQSAAERKAAAEAQKTAVEQSAAERKAAAEAHRTAGQQTTAEEKSAAEMKAAAAAQSAAQDKAAAEAQKATKDKIAAETKSNSVGKAASETNAASEAKASDDEQKAAEIKAATEAQKTAEDQIAAETEAAAEAQAAAEEKAATEAKAAADAQAAAEAKAAADARQAAEEQKAVEAKIKNDAKMAAAKAKSVAEHVAKGKEGVHNDKLNTETTRDHPALTNKGNNDAKATSKQTIAVGGKSKTKPATLTTSKNSKSSIPIPNRKTKLKNKKTTTTAASTTKSQTVTSFEDSRKAKTKKSRLFKRETSAPSIYTAKDVAALEVIVDLMKEPAETATVRGYNHQKVEHHPSTNAIQVHIALPYQTENKKRAAEATKLRKVFAAKMSVPVDIEYQVRSLDVGERTPSPRNPESCISPGMYLLVEDAKNNFALKPVIRQIKNDFVTSTIKTSPKNLARVTLSKDYIQSINKQLIQLYQNLSSLEQPTTHSIKKRHEEKLRLKKRINWDGVRKLFGSDKRVCNCKCAANQTMCKACAVSDAVMTELLFEFENLAQYMNDHCTEIQTYFWMNPSGGRKLRDIVHQIDKNINDYYKRVKGKCQGRPCSSFDKREITVPYIENENAYIGKPLINDIENLAKSLQEARTLRLGCNEKFKDIVDKLVSTSKECIKDVKDKRSVPGQKKVYTLDNINVNIICNKETLPTIPSPPSTVYDFLSTEFPILDYTDDEIQKKTKKTLKKIFKRKNTNSHKKASKRDTNVQIESPLIESDRKGLWKEYLKQAETTTEYDAKPVITLDVLEKIDENTVTFNPRLKATLVKIMPGSFNNSNPINDVVLKMTEMYPIRVSRDNDYFTLDDLITNPQPDKNELNELSNLFETKDINGYLKNRFAKSTSKSAPKEQKIEIKSSVKTVTASNTTIPIGIVPENANTTTIASSQISSRNTDSWVEIASLNDTFLETTPPTTKKATTKESWLHRLKSMITPSRYTSTKKTTKSNEQSKLHPQEMINKLNVDMNANIDVNSDVTTTSYPTLFIIEDVPNDEATDPESYENLLIKVMEYERDKIDSELTKHKKRQHQQNKMNKKNEIEINDMLNLDHDRDLRVTEVVTNSNPVPEKETEAAEGDYCIYKSIKNCKTAWMPTIASHTPPSSTVTPEIKERKNLIQMLLQSVKRNSAKAGKQPANNRRQQIPRRETAKLIQYSALPEQKSIPNKELARPRQQSPEIWREPMMEPQGGLSKNTKSQEATVEHQQDPKEINQKSSESHRKPAQIAHQHFQKPQQPTPNVQTFNTDNVEIFLAQFASTIIFTDPNYRHIFSSDKPNDKMKIFEEQTTPYNNLLEISATNSSESFEDDVPYLMSVTPATPSNPNTMVFTKTPVSINTTATVVSYSKKKPPNFALNVYLKKGKAKTASKLGNKTYHLMKTFTSNETNQPKIKTTPNVHEILNASSHETHEANAATPKRKTTMKETTTKETTTQEIISETPPENQQNFEDDQEIYDEEKELEDKTTETKKCEDKTTIKNTKDRLPVKNSADKSSAKNTAIKSSSKSKSESKVKSPDKTADELTTKIDKQELSPKPDNKNPEQIKAKNCTIAKTTPVEEISETSLKKILNKDLKKISKQMQNKEACDPKTELCVCDIRATSEHVVDVRKTSRRKDFEQYARNISCYKYKKPPPYFLLELWKRKTPRRNNQKQNRMNKYFDSVPLKKSLKWDWIRRRRSLSSIGDNNVDDNDDFDELNENNYYIGNAMLRQESNTQDRHVKGNKTKKRKYLYKDYDKNSSDDYESLYKGADSVYRARKRQKRTTGDIKELAHGLTNLPPLTPKENELYAMQGDKVSLDCLQESRYYMKSTSPVSWHTDRSDMLSPPRVVVNGPAVIFNKVEAKYSGNYTCTQGDKTRTVKLTVITLPQYHVVFIPIYASEHGCSYDDLRALQRLGPLMSKQSYAFYPNNNSVQIDEPICLEDKDDGTVHLRATSIITACPHPEVRCSAQCRRDLQCAFALLCANNAPVLHNVKVVVARQGYNKTLIPAYGTNRRLIVTHTLRKKDLQKHAEYHQLAASMYPGNLDIVVSCPAGFYLIPKQKICAACPADTYAGAGENTCYSCAPGTTSEPGAARCRLSLRRMRRYDWWWYPPCGYAVGAVAVLCACVLCTACALVAHVTSRSTARAHAAAVSVARVDSRWTWSRQAAAKRCSSTSADGATRGGPPSPSAVILARFFRPSASSSRATDSQETKFEQWKEKNIPPPLPPIDFDLG